MEATDFVIWGCVFVVLVYESSTCVSLWLRGIVFDLLMGLHLCSICVRKKTLKRACCVSVSFIYSSFTSNIKRSILILFQKIVSKKLYVNTPYDLILDVRAREKEKPKSSNQ